MRNKEVKKYVGIHNDMKGGMTDTAKIIRDAWVFGIIPETQTCEGWLSAGIEDLWEKTNQEWEKYGFLVSNLPEELKQRFMRIQAEAIKKAKAGDWHPERDLSDDT
jgi:hypothetical protein